MPKAKWTNRMVVEKLESEYEVNYAIAKDDSIFVIVDDSIKDVVKWLNGFGFHAIVEAYGKEVSGMPVAISDIEIGVKFRLA